MLGETAQRASLRSRDTSPLAKSSSEISLPWASTHQGEQQSRTELIVLMAVPGEGSTSVTVSAKSSSGDQSLLWQEPAVK